MKYRYLLAVVGLSIGLGGCGAQSIPTPAPTPLPTPSISSGPSATPIAIATESAKPATASAVPAKNIHVALTTSKGVIELLLYSEKTPQTVQNFLTKAKTDYYKNLTFHRVEDWVIQGGDPQGTGRGGGTMPTELSDQPFTIGSLGVARGMDIKISNDSQFFICVTDCGFLTGKYTNFGTVVKGMDVVEKIAIGDKILSLKELK